MNAMQLTSPPYINVHSHHPSGDTEVRTLLGLYEHFEQAGQQALCSIGLHPWYLDDLQQQMQQLEHYVRLPQVAAIGECGLDKVCPTPWALQEEAFRFQIALANTINKPLVSTPHSAMKRVRPSPLCAACRLSPRVIIQLRHETRLATIPRQMATMLMAIRNIPTPLHNGAASKV